MKIQIATRYGIKNRNASPVNIGSAPDFQFAAHYERGLGHSWWVVTELSSGAAAGEGFTKAQAIQNAENNINGVGVNSFRSIVAKSAAEFQAMKEVK